MTPVILLDELKKFIEENTKDIILSVRTKPSSEEPNERSAEVHKMRLPDKDAETKRVPYILLQFLTGIDDQEMGQSPESECKIRIVIATYSEDGGEGAMDALNVVTRIRISLLKIGVIGGQFILKKPLEYIVYPDDTSPYYFSEMILTFDMPEIKREV